MSQPWTFARVFKRMYEKNLTGRLEVFGPAGEITIHLREGKVVNVENTDGAAWKLGDFLLESETLVESQLYRAMKKARKAGEPVEANLLRRKLLTEDILRRFVELEVKETIFPLFRKTGVTCQFEDVPPQDNPWLSPIPVSYFLRGAKKRVQAWPRLLKQIPDDDLVLDKVDAYIGTILGKSEALVSVAQDASEGADTVTQIGANERIVYYYVNGRKTVRQLAYASCLGEFETTLALTQLYDRGFIDVAQRHGQGEKLKRRRSVLPIVARTLAYLGTLALVVSLAWFRPGALQNPVGFVRIMPPQLSNHLQSHHRARLEHALDRFFVSRGEWPVSLTELVESGVVDPRDIEAPWDVYIYERRTSDAVGYALRLVD